MTREITLCIEENETCFVIVCPSCLQGVPVKVKIETTWTSTYITLCCKNCGYEQIIKKK